MIYTLTWHAARWPTFKTICKGLWQSMWPLGGPIPLPGWSTTTPHHRVAKEIGSGWFLGKHTAHACVNAQKLRSRSGVLLSKTLPLKAMPSKPSSHRRRGRKEPWRIGWGPLRHEGTDEGIVHLHMSGSLNCSPDISQMLHKRKAPHNSDPRLSSKVATNAAQVENTP